MWILQASSERFFTPEKRRLVEALFDGLLPGADDAPGARDVDAAEYVDRLLAMDESTYYEIPAWRRLYDEALPLLEAASRTRYGRSSVEELTSDELTELLDDLSQGRLPETDPPMQRRIFTVLRSHCIEGCFADPRWGGNRDALMWRWLGTHYGPEEFHRDP